VEPRATPGRKSRLEFVSEVDEMCLFHQLGYANGKRGWPQSTVAPLLGLGKMQQV